MSSDSHLQAEARSLGHYLVNQPISQILIDRYTEAVETKGLSEPVETRLWRFACKSRLQMALVDSGLALVDPHSDIRNRILLMFAILEATTEYNYLFLPQQRSKLYLIAIGWSGLSAAIKGVVGWALVKVIGLR